MAAFPDSMHLLPLLQKLTIYWSVTYRQMTFSIICSIWVNFLNNVHLFISPMWPLILLENFLWFQEQFGITFYCITGFSWCNTEYNPWTISVLKYPLIWQLNVQWTDECNVQVRFQLNQIKCNVKIMQYWVSKWLSFRKVKSKYHYFLKWLLVLIFVWINNKIFKGSVVVSCN